MPRTLHHSQQEDVILLYIEGQRTPKYQTIHMGGCQNYGPSLGTLNIRCRAIIGTQKGTIILTTTHMRIR